jgi:hypothetical protein
MHIGIDFDNTIVCYDTLFHRVALERGWIPPDLPANKSRVRQHLQGAGREDAWIELQGCVYGARLPEAAPYPGVLRFFQDCRRAGIGLSIISHKTRHPVLGQSHDLHQAAMNWLQEQGFFDPAGIGLSRSDVFWELTRAAKLGRIAERGCTHFIDDLPEVLSEPAFPKVERILFDPNGLHGGETEFPRVLSWTEIWDKVQSAAAPEETEQGIKEFLAERGFARHARIIALSGGGNNRVYLVPLAGGDAVLKQYFQHAPGTHDRFGSERAIYNYLWARGLRRTPEPLAWDARRRLGLLSFVPGRKLQAGEIVQAAVDQALEFLLELNRDRNAAPSAALPTASTACFSVGELCRHISQRLERLGQMEEGSDLDREARAFVLNSLTPAWQEVGAALARGAAQFDQPLAPRHRVLSPSDFGFHNALLAPDNRLRFFDFEYAGWDDPCQMIGDFFCQPQIPVGLEFWEQFVAVLARELNLEDGFAQRARRCLPALRIKWCCILLNEFSRDVRARRDFARGSATTSALKAAQLAKARRFFQTPLPNGWTAS